MSECFGFILFLIVAGLVGWVADLIIPGRMPYGWLGGVIAALIGGFIGGVLFGGGGPYVGVPGGFVYYLIPGLLGTILFAFIVRLLLGQANRRRI